MEIKPDTLCITHHEALPVTQVTAIRHVGGQEGYMDYLSGRTSVDELHQDCWLVDPPVTYSYGGVVARCPFVRAQHLIPLSDPDQSVTKEARKPVEACY